MSKRNQKKQKAAPAQATNNVSPASVGASVGDEDRKILELAKQAMKDNELDIQEFIKLLEDDYTNEYNVKKEGIDSVLEEEKAKIEAEFKAGLEEKHKELAEENDTLAKSIAEENKKLSSLKKEAEGLEGEKKKVLDKAQEEADKIVEEAKKAADEQNKDALDKIEQKEDELKTREEGIEDKELEIESKELALGVRERRVQSLAQVYETANPEKLASLTSKIELLKKQIESDRKEFEELQNECNRLRREKMRADGISPEELQKENDQLQKYIEELENKCNRYTDFQLNEMQAAFDEKDGYLTQIRNLTNEVSSNRLELTRLNNSILEYEQMKSQMELLRTLNDHLKNELDNTKRMLESNVGDVCPALTGIDIEEISDSSDSYTKHEDRISKGTDDIKTLNELVMHVKRYAASQTKPLFYEERDLRAFIAGLASSPLSILQGMSGTGKTSLPKIFSEAIFGEINVVSVESSWRDRNELLGYYNDFSKKFTAKEFTCDLYRAGCERYDDTIYFIVLDEMNLSRVEYYFADFLSVLEDKKENWRIKLVDTDMRQLPTELTPEVLKALEKDKTAEAAELLEIVNKLYSNNKLDDEQDSSVAGNDKLRLITYLSNKRFKNKAGTRALVGGPQNLIGGNTIRIPKNVWFIGTANRDESTFEITDKVYDRAQVLNFNNRASGTRITDDVPQLYLRYSQLIKMFNAAGNDKKYTFKAEDSELLQKIEGILKKYFRVSYGNRIQDQMNTFVPVYVAAGRTPKSKEDDIHRLEIEAIDYQLTNKVLRKLEYEEISTDAAAALRKIFESNGMTLATDFINWKTKGEEA